MSGVSSQFAIMTRASNSNSKPGLKIITETPKVTYKGKETTSRYCFTCQAWMPHVIKDGKLVCVVCSV